MSKKAGSKPGDTKPEVEKAKRVYRAALDVIRRLDDIIKQKKAYRDVFLPEAITLRNRLQDYCERLMFYDPVEFGRKAEELLWRKVYYDVIQLMKHNRRQMRPSSSLESAFRTHLVAAAGYYHHMLVKLQYEYNLRLQGVVDFYHVPEPKAHKKLHHSKKIESDPRVQDWALRACHRSLIYLGDIARYQQDYDGMPSKMLSQRYYYQALALCPDIGMPFNQLGTLAGTRYYSADAGYHYLRCLVCSSSFEGAQGNLTRLFDKNNKRYHDLNQKSPRDLPPEQQRSKDIKRFLVRFMHLLDIFLNPQKGDNRELQDCCQETLQDFNLVMFYQPPHVTNPSTADSSFLPDDKAQYLDDELVFKILIMCMTVIYQLQKTGNKQVTAAIAFSLALFSHLLNHVVIHLQSALYELEHPRKMLDLDNADLSSVATTDATDEELDLPSMDEDLDYSDRTPRANSQERVHDKNIEKFERKRKRLAHMRRKRRRRRDSGSTDSNANKSSGDDSDLSEGVADVNGGSGSDSDEVIDYLQGSQSSSDSDDNLMVSQELRPGFSDNLNNLNNQLSNGLNSSVNVKDQQIDMAEYLKNYSSEFFNNSSNFLSDTLKLSNLFPHKDEDDEDLSNADITDVVQGKKQVSVPPGFDKDPESLHVWDISEKLANFVIETDTDTTSMPTDTENSSLPTESELETTETDHESAESVVDKTEYEERRLERLLVVIGQEGLLNSIKIYCDWMRCHPAIIASCAQSSQSLWSRLSVLLNFLPLESDLAKIELCESEVMRQMVAEAETQDWHQTQPLCEDVHLQGFPPVRNAVNTLTFDAFKRMDLSPKQEAILRICCLRKFGYVMSRMESIQFSYDTERCMFYGPLQLESQQDEKSAQEKMADAEARRNQLMKDMAQLRLQAEVNQLEGSLKAVDTPNLPPYLIADSTALCDNLHQVKQLANSARFIIIVPLAVIDHLDMLKKDHSGSREAIRWLEVEFRKGNRYVRAQKSHEKTSSIPYKNLKKRDREAWRFIQILDCCKYLSEQSTECDPRGLVCILTDVDPASPGLSVRLRQAMVTAQQEGVTIEQTADFFTKWKDLWKGNKG